MDTVDSSRLCKGKRSCEHNVSSIQRKTTNLLDQNSHRNHMHTKNRSVNCGNALKTKSNNNNRNKKPSACKRVSKNQSFTQRSLQTKTQGKPNPEHQQSL
jgi:hypothetical protein